MRKFLSFSLAVMLLALFTGCSSDDIQTGSSPIVTDVQEGQVISYESGLVGQLKDGRFFVGEGIVLSEEQIKEINEPSNLRAGLVETRYRWTDRQVPFRFKQGDFTLQAQIAIRNAFEQFNSRTCVKVREATSYDKDYILITNESNGAWSYLGRQGGEQQLNLEDNINGTTLIPGVIIKTMLTAMGTIPEHNRPDRDDFIQINWNNIRAGAEYYFNKYTWVQATNFGVDFDYESVTFPANGKYYYSRNGQPTMEVIGDPSRDLGNILGLTQKDILSLNRMYNCQ